MVEVAGHAPGSFCFVEAGSVDVDVSSRFYEAIFCWQSERRHSSEGRSYRRFLKGGKPVAGMWGVEDDQDTVALPTAWLTYVCVDDAAATLAKAVERGATPFGDMVEVPGLVTVAEFVDPEGAVCGLWQSGGHIGASYVDEPGALSWSDLLTSDAGAAASFYGDVFGWTTRELVPGAHRFFVGGSPGRGGMSVIGAETGTSPQWRAHFGVSELDEAAAAVATLGGVVKGQPTDVPGVGRRLDIEDPVGLDLALIEIAQPEL